MRKPVLSCAGNGCAGNDILCSGWSSVGNLYVSEIEKTLNIDGNYVLYDFLTPPDFRNNGYYKIILYNIKILYHRVCNKYIFLFFLQIHHLNKFDSHTLG